RRYAIGDHVVLLAPNPDERLVTSERLIVTDVDLPGALLRAVTAEGRPVVLSGEAIDAEHLDHGYALTIHRAQGATYDRAHVLAAGGGRELAYVALSRARTGTTLHAVADDLDQARHDLGLDWRGDRQQRWITDTAVPAPQPSIRTVEAEQTPEQRRFAALGRLDALNDDLQDLYAGRGRWQHTPEGANARTLNDLRARLDAAQRQAAHPDTRRRERRSALREADVLAPALEAAEAIWQAVGQPSADDLQRTITSVEAHIERDDLAERRQYLASLLDRRTLGLDPVEREVSCTRPDAGHEGIGL
ncbi:MAG TPA: hypothetical protein VF228_00280, partial [Iamia sp.]